MKIHISILLLLTSFLVPNSAEATSWVDVSSDGNSYLVSGGAIFHERFEDEREKAATCTDCFWQVQRTCLDFDPFDRGPCPELLASCPKNMTIAEVQFAKGAAKPAWDSSTWKFVSHTCIGPLGPISSREVIHKIQSSLKVRVPSLKVETSPPKRTLVNLPMKVKQLSASKIRYSNLEVAGIPVKLWAESALVTRCQHCREVPEGLVAKRSGRIAIEVEARWSAWYTALGISPIKVGDPQVRQRKTLWISVSELKSRFWKVGRR
jgi:hypothetical protein